MAESMQQPGTSQHAGQYEHPSWCAATMCSQDSTDLVHREVGELFTPSGNPRGAIQVERLRDDEVGESGQTIFPTELQVTILNGGVTVLTAGEAVQLAALLVGMAKAV